MLNKKMLSLNFLKPNDFPGFFTIKNFLIMLDGIYSENFFLRDEGKQLFRNKQHLRNVKEEMKI